MQSRLIQATDYLTIANWWSDWGFPIIPPDYLPTTGVMMEDEENQYCAGWLYQMDCKLCMIEWIVSNKNAPTKQRSEALNLLIENLCGIAKDRGFKSVFSSLKIPSLIKRFEKQGFLSTDTGMTNVIRRL